MPGQVFQSDFIPSIMSPTSSTTALPTQGKVSGAQRSRTMEIDGTLVEVVVNNLPPEFTLDMLKGLFLFTRGLINVQMDSKQHTTKGPVASAFFSNREDAELAAKSLMEQQEKSGRGSAICIWVHEDEGPIAGSESYTTSNHSFFSSPDRQAVQRAVMTQREQSRALNGNTHAISASPESGSGNENGNLTYPPAAGMMNPQLLQQQQMHQQHQLQQQQQLLMANPQRAQQFLQQQAQQVAMSSAYPPNWMAPPNTATNIKAPISGVRSIPIAAHLDRLIPETIEPRNPPSRWYPGWDPPRKVVPPDNPKDNHPPSKTLYVGNLPRETTEAEIFDIFSTQNGYVKMLFVVKAAGPMCFVEFENVYWATEALKRTNGTVLADTDLSRGGMRLSFSKNHINQRDAPLTIGHTYANQMDPATAALLRNYFQQQQQQQGDRRMEAAQDWPIPMSQSIPVQSPMQMGYNYSLSPTSAQPIGMANNGNMATAQFQLRQPIATSTDSLSDSRTITSSFWAHDATPTPRPDSTVSLNMSLDNGLTGLAGIESSRWMMPGNVPGAVRQQPQTQMNVNANAGMNNGATGRFEKRTGSLAPGTPWNNINNIWATGGTTNNGNGNSNANGNGSTASAAGNQ